MLSNLGDGQVGIYLKLPQNMLSYRMTVMQEGRKPRKIEDHLYRETRYAVASVSEFHAVRIEEVAQEAP